MINSSLMCNIRFIIIQPQLWIHVPSKLQLLVEPQHSMCLMCLCVFLYIMGSAYGHVCVYMCDGIGPGLQPALAPI